MEKMLNTGRITQRVEQKLFAKKAMSVDCYTNYYEYLTWIKEEKDLVKFQEMLNGLLRNWLIRPKEKAELIAFFYPKFEEKVCEVKKVMNAGNKRFKFELKPVINMIFD